MAFRVPLPQYFDSPEFNRALDSKPRLPKRSISPDDDISDDEPLLIAPLPRRDGPSSKKKRKTTFKTVDELKKELLDEKAFEKINQSHALTERERLERMYLSVKDLNQSEVENMMKSLDFSIDFEMEYHQAMLSGTLTEKKSLIQLFILDKIQKIDDKKSHQSHLLSRVSSTKGSHAERVALTMSINKKEIEKQQTRYTAEFLYGKKALVPKEERVPTNFKDLQLKDAAVSLGFDSVEHQTQTIRRKKKLLENTIPLNLLRLMPDHKENEERRRLSDNGTYEKAYLPLSYAELVDLPTTSGVETNFDNVYGKKFQYLKSRASKGAKMKTPKFLCQNSIKNVCKLTPHLLHYFESMIKNRMFVQSKIETLLAQGTSKEKISHFLQEQQNKQKDMDAYFIETMSAMNIVLDPKNLEWHRSWSCEKQAFKYLKFFPVEGLESNFEDKWMKRVSSEQDNPDSKSSAKDEILKHIASSKNWAGGVHITPTQI